MADASVAAAPVADATAQQPDSEPPNPDSLPTTTTTASSSSSSCSSSASSSGSVVAQASISINPNSYPPSVNPPAVCYLAPPMAPSSIVVPPSAPSFRPAIQHLPMPPPPPPFSVLQPPGVNSVFTPLPFQLPHSTYPSIPPYAPPPNGFLPLPPHAPPASLHPGIPRFPPMYAPGVRPPYPLRPPGTVVPLLPRGPITGIRGPIISPILRPPIISSATTAEKQQTTVYVGKIAPTVENDFILSLLNLCGTVKSWKRAQNPSDGTPGGFGFCEFDSAEGVLRALRLLSKFKVDGQELMLNVNQTTRKSLEDYVEKKSESTKKDEKSDNVLEKERGEVDAEKNDAVVSTGDGLKKNLDDYSDKDKGNSQFGIVTSEERDTDAEVLGKLKSMIEERLKAKPLPPPPPPPSADHIENLKLEAEVKARDNESDAEISKTDMTHEKHDDDSTNDTKHTIDQDKNEPRSPERSRRERSRSPERGRREFGSPERSRRYDRGSRDRDRDRDLRREKEREIERYERERERERVKRERDRESRTREAEQLYRERVKDWELREREKEYQRLQDKNREKDRQHQRRKEIRDQERESDEDDDDESSRKYRRKFEEKRKKRLREKDEDLADRLKEEEEEIAEAKRRAEEEHKQLMEKEKINIMASPSQIANGSINFSPSPECKTEDKDITEEPVNVEFVSERPDETGEESYGDEANAASDGQSFAPAKKLGFGLLGLGKRAAVPSVFNAEEDDGHEEKKLRPLVPIDYSTEELHVKLDSAADISANVMDPPKRVSNTSIKEEKNDMEREASRYPHDRHSHHDRDRNDTEYGHFRDGNRDREHRSYKLKAADNKKLLDAKQLIDMIPKTKDELFSYDINWAIYDKHELQERMRPWIGKKITEFLGEEETSLVDYIVSSMQNHVKAGKMLDLLHSILDDEAEMFVLKMWRMLIFEIKKVETGLSKRC